MLCGGLDTAKTIPQHASKQILKGRITESPFHRARIFCNVTSSTERRIIARRDVAGIEFLYQALRLDQGNERNWDFASITRILEVVRGAAFGQMRSCIGLPDLSRVGWWGLGSWGALLGSGVGGTNDALVFIETPFCLHAANNLRRRHHW